MVRDLDKYAPEITVSADDTGVYYCIASGGNTLESVRLKDGASLSTDQISLIERAVGLIAAHRFH